MLNALFSNIVVMTFFQLFMSFVQFTGLATFYLANQKFIECDIYVKHI